MNTRGRPLGAVLVLALVVGASVWWLSREEPDSAQVTPSNLRAPPAPRVVDWKAPVAGSLLKLRVSVLEAGKPVAGATVSVNDKTTTSDAAGEAVLDVAPGAVVLSGQREGRVVRRGLVLSPLLGDQHVTLVFEDGRRRELTVLDSETGQPIAGARVELQLEADHTARMPNIVFTTDGVGHANVLGFKMDEFTVTVSHPDYLTALAGPDDEDVQLERRIRFTGRVLFDDGTPAAGATVTTSFEGSEPPATVTTSSDGTFTLDHAGEVLCARLGDLETSGSVDVATEAGLMLTKIPPFSGQVVSAVGDQPLAGVRVRTTFGAFAEESVSDPDGNFVIASLCTSDTLSATFELAGFVSESAELEPGEKTVVRLGGHGALRGSVIDEQGVGVEGATVTARDNLVFTESVTKTDADGRFSFERVKRDLELSAVLGTRSITQEVIVEAGQLVEVTLPISGERQRVPVEVLEEGKPSQQICKVTARRLDGPPLEETIQWGYRVRMHGLRTDEWVIQLPVGSYKVTASNEEIIGETEFRVEKREVQPPLRIHVFRKPPPTVYPIRVQVLSSQNLPVAGVHVSAPTCDAARTDAEGRTLCQMKGPQMQTLTASHGGASASFQVTNWSDEVVLRLSPGIMIRGHFVGEVPAGLEVLVLSKDGSGTAQVSSNHFVLVDQPTTRSVLCLRVGEERLGCTVVVSEGRREADATIPVGAPGELRFTVIDSSAQPVLDPVLYLDRRTNWRGSVDGVVKTPVAPGDHVIVVNVDGTSERYEAIFKVESGVTTDLGRVQVR